MERRLGIYYHPDSSSGYMRGLEAEQKAAGLIGSLDYIERVRLSTANSRLDSEGKDLTVFIQEDVFAINSVFVQVKASSSVRKDFKEKLKRMGLSTHEDRRKWMLENRFILLVVGDRSDNEILMDFENQLIEIDNYYVASLRDR